MKYLVLLALLAASALAANLTFIWDPNPPDEEVVVYRLYTSSNAVGPFTFCAATTNGTQTTLTITNAVQGRAFFYLTASNFWGESLASDHVNTPTFAGSVKGTSLHLGWPEGAPAKTTVQPKGIFRAFSQTSRGYVFTLIAARQPSPPFPK